MSTAALDNSDQNVVLFMGNTQSMFEETTQQATYLAVIADEAEQSDGNTISTDDAEQSTGAVISTDEAESLMQQNVEPVLVKGAANATRFTVTSGNTLTIQNTTYSGLVWLSKGGAGEVEEGGTLIVNNVTFSGNTVAYGSNNSGGAIYNAGTCTLSNTTFSGNLAKDNSDYSYGGAVCNYNTGVLNINNVIFSGNTAANGGAVCDYNFNSTAQVSIISSTFTGNTAIRGGAIHIYNRNTGSFSISDSIFSGNIASDEGGVISDDIVSEYFTYSISGCTFSGNTSGSNGGAVSIVNATITNCVFDKNICTGTSITGGGAIEGKYLTIYSCTFTGNTAAYGGGIGAAESVTLKNVTFDGNVATTVNGGGAIRCNDFCMITLEGQVTLMKSSDTIYVAGGTIQWDITDGPTEGSYGQLVNYRYVTVEDDVSNAQLCIIVNADQAGGKYTIATGVEDTLAEKKKSYILTGATGTQVITVDGSNVEYGNRTYSLEHDTDADTLVLTVLGDIHNLTGDSNISSMYGGSGVTFTVGGKTVTSTSAGNDVTVSGKTVDHFEVVGYTNNAGVTISGGSFTMPDQDVTVKAHYRFNVANEGTLNLAAGTYTNELGYTGNGGMGEVQAGGTLTANKVTFSGNTITGVWPNAQGGAVRIGGYASFSGATFTENTAARGGGAICVDGGTASFTDTVIKENNGEFGGAVYATGSTVSFNGGTFSANISTNDGGAGCLAGSIVTIDNVEFTGNTASNAGGGALSIVSGSTVTVQNSLFDSNVGNGAGGAICIDGTSVATFNDVDFSGNCTTAWVGGGAIRLVSGTSSFTGGTFSGNHATWGGAAWISCKTDFSNTLFANNYSDNDGGAVCQDGGSNITYTNVTFAGNTALNSTGGALSVVSGGTATLMNVTFSGNSAKNGGGAIYNNASTVIIAGTATLSTSTDTFVNTGTVKWDLTSGTSSYGCLNGYQYFTNNGSLYITVNDSQKNGEYIIATGVESSLDSSKNTFKLTGAGGDDVSITVGDSNVEYGNRIYSLVKDDTNLVLTVQGGGFELTGDSNIQTMYADSGVVFTVSGGTVTEAKTGDTVTVSGKAVDQFYAFAFTSDDVTISGNSFTMPDQDVTVKAHYRFDVQNTQTLELAAGTYTNELGWDGYGGMGVVRSGGTLTANNVTFAGNTTRTVEGTDANGGAISNMGGTADISGSTFTQNMAADWGGALDNSGDMTISNSTFSGNTAGNSGGAINAGSGSITITASVFTNNISANGGGAIVGGAVSVSSSTFTGNTSYAGGAVNVGMNSEISGSLFSNNFASYEGGAVYDVSNAVTISSCTFTGNTSETPPGSEKGSRGGAVVIKNGGSGTITNSIFDENASDNGGAVYNEAGSVSVSGSTFSGNTSSTGAVYVKGSAATVSIESSTFSENTASNAGGGLRIHTGSGTVTDSVFAGNAASVSGGAIYNGDKLSVTGVTFSGNTAENYGGAVYNAGTATINGVTFSGNTAKTYGGAIYNTKTVNLTGDVVFSTSSDSVVWNITAGTSSYATMSGYSYLRNNGNAELTIVVINEQECGKYTIVSDAEATLADSKKTFTLRGVDSSSVNITVDAGNVEYGSRMYSLDRVDDTKLVLTVGIPRTLTGDSNISPMYEGGVTFTVYGSTATKAKEGDVVTVSGKTVDQFEFVGYTNNAGVTITDDKFTMPDQDITVKAQYRFDVANGGTLSLATGTYTNELGYSGNGGMGVVQAGGTLTANSVTFAGNTAAGGGGAVSIAEGASVTIQNSVLTDNTGAWGGAAWINGNANVSFTGSTFTNNSATNGHSGAVDVNGATASFENVTFKGNFTSSPNNWGGYGGAVGVFGTSVVTFNDVNFDNNHTNTAVEDGGGAVRLDAGTSSFTGGTFTGNYATWGGAAWISCTADFSDCTFENNYTVRDSGAVCQDASNVTYTNVTFTGNTAGTTGGALGVVGSGTATLKNVTFSGNSAGGNGGAVNNTSTVILAGTATLSTATDTFYNAGTVKWDLTGGTANGCLNGYQYFTNNGSLYITVTNDQQTGEYTIATGVTDVEGKNQFTLTGATGTQVITVGDSDVEYGDRIYSLAQNGTDLVLTVTSVYALTGDSNISPMYAGGITFTVDDKTVTKAKEGDTVTVSGKAVDQFEVAGYTSDDVTISGNSFTMPDQDVTVKAHYRFNVANGNALDLVSGTYTNELGYNGNGGMGVVQAGGTLTANNVTFLGNTATGDGGAVYANAAVTVTGSTFTGNTATGSGGAVYAANGGTITDSIFDKNVSTGSVYGGAVYANEAVTITGSTFSGNTAADCFGGAVYVSQDSTITNSVFDKNVGYSGGAVYAHSNDTITGSTFSGNMANKGGAVCSKAALTISSSTFTGNTATTGGAVYSAKGDTITGSIFSGNTAATTGGAVYNRGALSLGSSTFTGNAAGTYGGAIYITGTVSLTGTVVLSTSSDSVAWDITKGTSSYATMSGYSNLQNNGNAELTIIVKNEQGSGKYTIVSDAEAELVNKGTFTLRGVDSSSVNITVDADIVKYGSRWYYLDRVDNTKLVLTVSEDEVYRLTGDSNIQPMYADSGAVFTVSGGTVTAAKEGDTVTVSGKAVDQFYAFAFTSDDVTISGNSFTMPDQDVTVKAHYRFNVANGKTLNLVSGTYTNELGYTGNGGMGEVQKYGTLTADNVTFLGNTATGNGGAVYAVGTVSISGSTFSGNTATSNGGAVYTANGSTITDSTFSGNTAGQYGGAVYAKAAVTVSGSTFSGNTAGYCGGAVYAANGGTITGSIFDKNITTHFGGAVYADKAVTVSGSTFSGNTANLGAVYAVYGGTITDSIFDKNVSRNSGGAVYGGTLSISGSTFSGNTAGYGGAVQQDGGSVTITGSTFSGNMAKHSGGAVYKANSGTITDSIFDKNVSTGDGGAVYSTGMLSLSGSTFSGNTATGNGGALNTINGCAISDSIFDKNVSTGSDGGAVYNRATIKAVSVSGSTFSGNTAADNGGAVYNIGTLSLSSSTFSGNSAGTYGGAIYSIKTVNLTGDVVLSTSSDSVAWDITKGTSSYATMSGYSNLQNNGNAELTIVVTDTQASGKYTIVTDAEDVLADSKKTFTLRGVDSSSVNITVDAGNVEYGSRMYSLDRVDDTKLVLTVGVSRTLTGDSNISPMYSGGVYFSVYGSTATKAKAGDIVTLSTAAVDQFEVAGYTSNDVTITGNSFTMPDQDVTVKAQYRFDVANSKTLTLVSGTYTNELGYDGNGGMGEVQEGGILTAENVTFSGNTAANKGGAIYNDGTITLSNVTFTGNAGNGGAIYNEGTVTLTGVVTLSSETDTFVNDDGVNWDLTSGMASCGKLNGYQYFTNNANLTITVNNDQAEGEYTIATGVTDVTGKNEFTLTGATGTQSITVDGDSVEYGNRTYRLAQNGTDLVLTVTSVYALTGDSNIQPMYADSGVVFTVDSETVTAAKEGDTVTISGKAVDQFEVAGYTSNDVTISGNSFTMPDQDVTVKAHYRFDVADGETLTLLSGTYTNELGYNGNGGMGVVQAGGTLTANNVTFTGNTASGSGGAVDANNYGDNTVSITDSTFSGNTARWDGGAMDIIGSDSGTITITGCTFSGNTASNGSDSDSRGGAIYNQNTASIIITDSTFSGNAAESHGGAVDIFGVFENMAVTVSGSTFSGNTAGKNGGAVHFDDEARIALSADDDEETVIHTLSNSVFDGNICGDYGGAIHCSSSLVTITGCTFSGNTASKGGGLYMLGTVSLSSVTFDGNVATDADGGGAILNVGGTINLTGSVTLSTDSDTVLNGGGVMNWVLTNGTSSYGCLNGYSRLSNDYFAVGMENGTMTITVNNNQECGEYTLATGVESSLADNKKEFTLTGATGTQSITVGQSNVNYSGRYYTLEQTNSNLVLTVSDGLTPVKYMDYSTGSKRYVEKTCTNYTILTGSETALTAGWYVIDSTTTAFGSAVSVTGDVHVIVKDNATLTFNSFNVTGGATLNLYGQSGFTGKVTSDGGFSGTGNVKAQIDVTATNNLVMGTTEFTPGKYLYGADGTLTYGGTLITDRVFAGKKITTAGEHNVATSMTVVSSSVNAHRIVSGACVSVAGDVTLMGGSSLTISNNNVFSDEYVICGSQAITGSRVTQDGSNTIEISGGTYTGMVCGAGFVGHKDSSYNLTGNVTMTISGGTFTYALLGGVGVTRSSYAKDSIVSGNINMTFDCSSNQITLNCVYGGCGGKATLNGDITMKFTGNGNNLNFVGKKSGVAGGNVENRGMWGTTNGDATLLFDDFNGLFNAQAIDNFKTLDFDNGSAVTFKDFGGTETKEHVAQLDTKMVEVWDFATGTSLNYQHGNNSFSGDELIFGSDGGSISSPWTVIDGGDDNIFAGLDTAESVTLFGESAEYDKEKSYWASTNYKLSIDTNNHDLVVSKLA